MKPLVLPIRIVSESNQREHWGTKNRRANGSRSKKKPVLGQRQTACFACRAHFAKPSIPCTIKLVRIAPRPLDQGNIAAAFKAVQDGCADWLGIDDRHDHLVKYEYANERGKPKEYAVRIEIVEANQ